MTPTAARYQWVIASDTDDSWFAIHAEYGAIRLSCSGRQLVPSSCFAHAQRVVDALNRIYGVLYAEEAPDNHRNRFGGW